MRKLTVLVHLSEHNIKGNDVTDLVGLEGLDAELRAGSESITTQNALTER